MKKLKYLSALVALSFFGTACNESLWLKETPYDFYTPQNSYTTTDQFQNSLNYLYDQVRGMHWKFGDQTMALICSDIASGGTATSYRSSFVMAPLAGHRSHTIMAGACVANVWQRTA